MKRVLSITAFVTLATAQALAGSRPVSSVKGDYVEARTAEVFTGGCIMGSQAETMGKEAVLAWRIDRGSIDGAVLDGLTVVAALAADRNLGIREMGGEGPTSVRAAIVVDERATPGQRAALVAFVRRATAGLVDRVVDVRPAAVRFTRTTTGYEVAAGDANLAVATKVEHGAGCGAMQWFHPLSAGTVAAVGMTRAQTYQGAPLGVRWRQVDKKSAFFGTFAFSSRHARD